MSRRTLNLDEARGFYDGFGKKQDGQGWYEDAALDELLAYAGFEEARAVLELGCGTGRLAERLLSKVLAETAAYHGIDLSPTMVALAEERTAPWQEGRWSP